MPPAVTSHQRAQRSWLIGGASSRARRLGSQRVPGRHDRHRHPPRLSSTVPASSHTWTGRSAGGGCCATQVRNAQSGIAWPLAAAAILATVAVVGFLLAASSFRGQPAGAPAVTQRSPSAGPPRSILPSWSQALGLSPEKSLRSTWVSPLAPVLTTRMPCAASFSHWNQGSVPGR